MCVEVHKYVRLSKDDTGDLGEGSGFRPRNESVDVKIAKHA